MKRLAAFLLLPLLLPSFGLSQATALLEYVNRPDNSFSFTQEESLPAGTATFHVLRLTSQEWRGIEWRHRLTVIVPASVEHPGTALIHVTAGSNREERPLNPEGRELRMAIDMANQARLPVAVLEHVPNQPLLRDLYEDDLIAYTFARQLETGDTDWPLLFPMVKSATRAMDAVTAFLQQETGAGPDEFILTGASKRGWTTWLTAAVDSRVAAIAPMVFDILNFAPQLELQRASFEGYSEMIRAYEEQNLFALLSTEAGMALGQAVDPFTYRKLLTMPKLILLGTNDPYWSVDAAGLYFADLPGPKHLFYAANAGHRIDSSMNATLLAFVRKTLDGAGMPDLEWEHSPANGELTATWDEADGEAWLWTAESSTRDFNTADWTRTRLDGRQTATAILETPTEGFSARYIEVRFPGKNGDDSFGLCTEIVVTPARIKDAGD